MLIPEGLFKKYDRLVQKYKVLLLLITLIIVIIYIVFIFWKFNKDFQQGADLSYLRENLTKELFDSCAVGLERYKEKNGEYPVKKGKFFFNSIKLLVYVDNAYIYRADKNAIDILKSNSNRDSLLLKDSLFMGVGRPKQYITYKYLNKTKYLLYSVGENGIDENGEGDDLVYKQ